MILLTKFDSLGLNFSIEQHFDFSKGGLVMPTWVVLISIFKIKPQGLIWLRVNNETDNIRKEYKNMITQAYQFSLIAVVILVNKCFLLQMINICITQIYLCLKNLNFDSNKPWTTHFISLIAGHSVVIGVSSR